MGLVLSTKNLILKELLLMTTHEGLEAWASRTRFIRLLTMRVELRAKV